MAVRFAGTQLMPGTTIDHDSAAKHRPVPRPVEPGERVELWTMVPGPSADAPEPGNDDDLGWDVRPARVAFTSPGQVGLYAGGWNLAESTHSAGRPARIRRLDDEGVAEWEGTFAADESAAQAPRRSSRELPLVGAHEALLVVTLAPAARPGDGLLPEGVLHQRRRSPRLPVGLTPVRIRPLPTSDDTPVDEGRANQNEGEEEAVARRPVASRGAQALSSRSQVVEANGEEVLPVARLTDVSEHGAGVVVDYPIPAGQPVALEFTLLGEGGAFTVRGRVVEPAVPLHGESRPQLDGLPGFRRGIEFLGTTAGREYRRLAEALSRRLRPRA